MTFQEQKVYQQRRDSLAQSMGAGSIGVWQSSPEMERTRDVVYPYQPNPDVFYLSGCDEPSATLLLNVLDDKTESILFVEEQKESAVVWEGPKRGLEEWKETLGVDRVLTLDQLEPTISSHLREKQTFYLQMDRHNNHENTFVNWLQASSRVLQGKRYTPTGIVDASPFLRELRERKDSWEVQQLRKAAQHTVEAHLAVMKAVRPGTAEAEVEALFAYELARRGSQQLSFPTIVAGGSNATILHYRKNNTNLQDNQMLLLDGGGEWGHYAADVSRTFPINGTFSKQQREVYSIVLHAHQAALAVCRPGSTWADIHQTSVRAITEGLVHLGVLDGDVKELVETKAYQPYFPHGTSHWLGLEVHDVGAREELDGSSRALQSGMVFTVEPGLYFNATLNPEQTHTQWDGIGVRIEDNILITDSGYENLTSDCPVTIDEIEAVMKQE